MEDPLILSQVSDHCADAELRQLLPGQVPVIAPELDQIIDFLAKLRKPDESEIDIEVALGGALANAVIHGNREHLAKRASVTCRCTRDGEVSIRVQDQRRGFDTDMIPDPTARENCFGTSGRGICLMKSLMDALHFREKGTVMHMLKRSNVQSIAERDAR